MGGISMKKRIPFLILVVCLLILVCYFSVAAYRWNQPDFEDFQSYEADFVCVKNFLVDYFSRNDTSRLIVDLNSQFLTIDGVEISDSTIEDSVKAIYDKGFTYIEINADCMIFWEDETGYYGVLWSSNPRRSINQIVESSRPYMKSRKLSSEWYEVGALNSI
jgi:hypothetical protein